MLAYVNLYPTIAGYFAINSPTLSSRSVQKINGLFGRELISGSNMYLSPSLSTSFFKFMFLLEQGKKSPITFSFCEDIFSESLSPY
jgi:hypothetical protein